MKRVYIILGLLFVAIILAFITVLEFFTHSDYSPNYSLESPAEYTELFNDSAKLKTVLYMTNLIKGRNAISEYLYDNKYSIILYKLNVPSGETLKSLIRPGYAPVDLSFFKTSSEMKINQVTLAYGHDSIPAVGEVLVTFYGDSAVNIFRNDSISCVKAWLNKLLIQYDSKRSVDIKIGIRDPFTRRIPAEFVFIHRGNGLFFIFISPIVEKQYLEEDLPRTILNHNFFKK